jgi:hypothetical protein
MTRPTMTARELVDRLRAHYLPTPKTPCGMPITAEQLLPGAVLLTEVPSPGGGRRRVDALVVNLTSARQGLDGFEVKVSRDDWQAELAAPAKADPWFAATHRWWVAAPSTEVVRPEELPAGWGLMVPTPRSATRMKVVVRADTHEPSVGWPVLWEIVKKIDRGRAGECAALAEQIRQQVLRQAREQVEQARAELGRHTGTDAVVGTQLAEMTGLSAQRLRFALERPSPWLREALRAVFAADDGPTGVSTEEVARHTRRLAGAHEQALATLNQVLAVLGEPSRTEHEETR